MRMRKLLQMMDAGNRTLPEMADQLGITQAELKNRLELMVQLGNLEAVHLEGGPGGTEEGCPGCVLAAVCRDEDSCTEGRPVVGYRLTEKGRRLARGTLGAQGEGVDG